MDAIYLDYAKAFDTVPHKRLLAKLSGYGIGGKLLKSTTNHRKWQQIIMDPSHERYTPRQRPRTAAVRLLRKDMPENITSTAYMTLVADYTKVYRNIKTHIDREVLQSDLSRLEDWSRK